MANANATAQTPAIKARLSTVQAAATATSQVPTLRARVVVTFATATATANIPPNFQPAAALIANHHGHKIPPVIQPDVETSGTRR